MKSRLATAEILGFVDYGFEVYPMMQKLSHTSRAYTVNAHGIKGFMADYNSCLFNEINWAFGLFEFDY